MNTRDDFIADYIFDWLSNAAYIEVDDELMLNQYNKSSSNDWV